MTDAIHPLERRRIATQATMDRFVGCRFDWGKNDCARMAAFHLKALGHPVMIAKAGSWSTALGAQRALARMGVASLSALAARHLTEIPPAAALIGDLLTAVGTDGFEGAMIALGNGAALGWHELDDTCVAYRLSYAETRAWRAL